MIGDMSSYQLLVVGRQLYHDGEFYYTNSEHCDFLNRFSQQFSKTTYISFSTFEKRPEEQKNISQLDSDINICANTTFQESNSRVKRIRSLRDDIKCVMSMPNNTVSYVFYPGVYSFLLAPFVLTQNYVSVSYFGNESKNAARSTSIKKPLGILKRLSYPLLQQYVIRNTDAAFVRDPRLKRYEADTEIFFSAPVTSFEPIKPANCSKQLSSPIKLLTVAAAKRVKGYQYLIEALSKLRSSKTRFQSVFVGQGVETYRSEAKNNRVEDLIKFVGHIDDQDELAKYYRDCDIFVLPSISEGFPRVLTESMSMGLPIVATNVGGIPYLLEDNKTAVLVDPANSDALAEGILRLVNNRALREEVSKNAYRWGREQISADPVQQQSAVVRELISSRAAR